MSDESNETSAANNAVGNLYVYCEEAKQPSSPPSVLQSKQNYELKKINCNENGNENQKMKMKMKIRKFENLKMTLHLLQLRALGFRLDRYRLLNI